MYIPGTSETHRLRGHSIISLAHMGMLCNPMPQGAAHIMSANSATLLPAQKALPHTGLLLQAGA